MYLITLNDKKQYSYYVKYSVIKGLSVTPRNKDVLHLSSCHWTSIEQVQRIYMIAS